jgi:hypothetical protein
MQSFLHSAKIGRAPEISLVYTRTRLGVGCFSISRLTSFSRKFAACGRRCRVGHGGMCRISEGVIKH